MALFVTETCWIAPRAVFTGGRLMGDCALRVDQGVVQDIAPVSRLAEPRTAVPVDGILSPPPIDLQVNGGGGVLFNATPTAEGIAAIIAAHRRHGTGLLLPTVISDTEDVLDRAVASVIGAWGLPGLAGIHIEGPHISGARRGTHDAGVLRPLGTHTMDLVQRLRGAGIPTMITVAPEVVPPAQIAALARTGAVVSIGHSDADHATARAAVEAGAACFTHLFNAMSPLTSRAPGVVGAALASAAHAGFICDGHHVSPETLSVALAVAGAKDRLFLVSDAMPTVGGAAQFRYRGMDIRLQDGRLVNPEGRLAGAHLTMAAAMANAVRLLGLSAEQALRMGISTPARVMGLDAAAAVTGTRLDDLSVWSGTLDRHRWLTDDAAGAGDSRG